MYGEVTEVSDIENEAVAHIAEGLTAAQRRALVYSLVQYGNQEKIILVGAVENTAQALQQGSYPLAYQECRRRFLTPLGQAVARHLNRSGEWELPPRKASALEVA